MRADALLRRGGRIMWTDSLSLCFSPIFLRPAQVPVDPLHTSLSHPLLSRLHHSVDVILFNPPYVPTLSEEAADAQGERDIGGAWAGGADGMQVTDRFFPQAAALLSPTGYFYLVAVAQNKVLEIQRRMRVDYALESEVRVIAPRWMVNSLMRLDQVVLQRRAGREHLFVIRFTFM